MVLKTQKGRSFDITIEITSQNGKPYVLESGETLRFGVKAPHDDSTYLIIKRLTSNDEINGKYPISLSPTDTNINARRYLYDCSLQTADGGCSTVLPTDYFVVEKSITYKGD